jgi:hypothetical protein
LSASYGKIKPDSPIRQMIFALRVFRKPLKTNGLRNRFFAEARIVKKSDEGFAFCWGELV